ncbi:MAG: D-alanine--D-alanine ligase [Candidatus Kuenenbacteria bacterium]
MILALCYNIRHIKPDINNPQYIKEAEFDEPSTIKGIKQALEKLGHKVFLVEANENAYLKFKKIKNKIDLVFNIAEGIYGSDREAQIPAMLEMLQIPYTGPRPLSYALGLDKQKTKEILKVNNIPTPAWLVIKQIKKLKKNLINFFPVIAKPVGEGSSKGICAANLVHNFRQLKKIVTMLLRQFKQPVLVEKFLSGREFTVAIIGEPPKILPIIEITFDKLPAYMPHFDHFEAKWVYDNPKNGFDPLICPAKITQQLKNQIKDCSLKAFNALGMADWARLDIRLDSHGIANVIEINCPPGIIPNPKENSRFPRAAKATGLTYEKMIETILKSACKRNGIKYLKK